MIAFLAYAMQVTLKTRLRQSAAGLTPRSALEKFATVQMLDMHLPTTDGREIILTPHTHPEKELQLLLDPLKLTHPPQAPPRITAQKRASKKAGNRAQTERKKRANCATL